MNKLKRKYKKLVSTRKGITLVQLFFVVIVIIALTVIFNPIDLITKTTRGRSTAAWSTDLTNLANNILSNRERYQMMYSIQIKNDAPPYDLTVAAPAVSTYDNMQKLIIEKNGTAERTLTYDRFSTVKYAETGSLTTLGANYKLYDYRREIVKESGASGQTQLKGLAHAGSNGIAPFINLSVPKVEEHLFLGMLGGHSTELGKDYEKNRKFTRIGTNAKLNDLLAMVFGSGNTTDLNNNIPDRWITLNLLDTNSVQKLVGGNSRFYDQDRYRLYWVSNVVSEAEAMTIAKTLDPAIDIVTGGAKTEDMMELYKAMIENVLQDTIVAMPIDKNDAVYSEKTDFKKFKFTTAD